MREINPKYVKKSALLVLFITKKQIEKNIKTVPNLPKFETFNVLVFVSTFNEPIMTKISLIKIPIKNQLGNKFDNQNNNNKKTILSHTGSNIVPNRLTKLNFLATIPSIESEIPISAIIITKFIVKKLSYEC